MPDFPHGCHGKAILITGIGCIGKSTLRRRVESHLSNRVVCIDRDDSASLPEVGRDQCLVVEAVHGLDEPHERWGLVVYLLPPPGHLRRWLRRGFAWFRTGRVDRPHRSVRKPWSLLNLPLIARIVVRNVVFARKWVREDLRRMGAICTDRRIVTQDANAAFGRIVTYASE